MAQECALIVIFLLLHQLVQKCLIGSLSLIGARVILPIAHTLRDLVQLPASVMVLLQVYLPEHKLKELLFLNSLPQVSLILLPALLVDLQLDSLDGLSNGMS